MDIEKTNDELRNKKFFDRGKKELKVKLNERRCFMQAEYLKLKT